MGKDRLVWLTVGLAAGVAAGLVVAGLAPWPARTVHAVATHGHEGVVICTAAMDDNVEAVFTLDCATGDLKAAVMNMQNRRFNSQYERNVLADMPLANVKNPQFRIVSGVTDFRQHAGLGQLGNSVVYVAECTTGQMMAYGVPWVDSRANASTPKVAALVPLDRWQFKNGPSN